ncbi:MAG TPA: VCBS repeat-containing protein, partial [Burkholderiaceae bacterium]|nr:VCBS repeat-containing protein [Burkholderiaceae bacterium]
MRFALLAWIALALALAGCIDPGDSTDGGSGSASWVQTDIAGADLDGDGRTDVITIASRQPTSGQSEGILQLYRQTSPGGFVTSQIQVGRHPWRLKVADINGDGAPDLLVLD